MEATLYEFGIEALADAVEFAPLIVRRIDGTILRWMEENTHLYGWTAEEAVGALSHDLLHTAFPAPLTQINAELHQTGRWCGDLVHTTKQGRRIVVASRWRLQRSTRDGSAVVTETNHDITSLRAAEEALRASEARALRSAAELQAIYDNVPVGIALTDRDHRYVSLNARMAEFSGFPASAHTGRAAGDILPKHLAQATEAARRQVFDTGEPVEQRLTGATTGTHGKTRHWIGRFSPVRDPATGDIWAVCSAVTDATERVEAEKAKDLLAREMSHRVKNVFAVVHAMAVQTLLTARRDPDQFARDFEERLQALARAHDLLTTGTRSKVKIDAIIQTALAPWLAGAIDLDAGSGLPASARSFAVGPQQAQALMLALHELATNATKYGALSSPKGRVQVRSSIGPSGIACLTWTETDGPPLLPSADRHGGFGSRLLRRALPEQLGTGATVDLDFAPAGLHATIRFTPSFEG